MKHETEIAALEHARKGLMEVAKEFTSAELQPLVPVAHNIAAFVTAATNSLDYGNRTIWFLDQPAWKDLMSNINRIFYAQAHTAIEIVLMNFCRRKSVDIKPSQRNELLKKFERKFKSKLSEDTYSDVKGFLIQSTPDRPSTLDVVNAALKASTLEPKEKKYFREFYEALSVLRNKGSHSDHSLSEHDLRKIKTAKMDFLVTDEGELQSKPGHYHCILKMTKVLLNGLE